MSHGVNTRQVQAAVTVMLTSASADIVSEEQKILRDKVSHEICKDTKSQTGESCLLSVKVYRESHCINLWE